MPQYAPDFDRRSPEGKAAFAVRSQDFAAVGDSLIMCRFTTERGGYGVCLNDNYVRMVNAATGWGMDLAELTRIGERIVNLERMYNVRQGLSRADDYLPRRFTEEAAPLYEFEPDPASGEMRRSAEPLRYGRLATFDDMLDRYYDLRGWSRSGIPTESTLRRLGLEECLHDEG